MIASTLERYGDDSNPADFDLHYVQPPPSKAGRRKSFIQRIGGSPQKRAARVLASDECPVLVAEWLMEPDKMPRR